MAKPPGFSHHAKAAKAAHDCGDHDTANHHIGKMFGLNRKAKKGAFSGPVMEIAEEVAEIPESPKGQPSDHRAKLAANFAKMRGKPS